MARELPEGVFVRWTACGLVIGTSSLDDDRHVATELGTVVREGADGPEGAAGLFETLKIEIACINILTMVVVKIEATFGWTFDMLGELIQCNELAQCPWQDLDFVAGFAALRYGGLSVGSLEHEPIEKCAGRHVTAAQP